MRAFARAALVALAAAAAACSRTDAPPSAGSRDAVVFTIAADPGTLDPLFAHPDANSVEQQLSKLVFLPFVENDATGRLVPVLLARIPSVANGDLSRDGRVITYRLRPEARWADGEPVTSRDVAFTVRAILDPRNPVRSRAGYDRIARVETPDAHTARVTLRAPWAPAVATLFGNGTAPQVVLPEHLLASQAPLERAPFGSAPVGDGPYRLVSWRRGDRLVYAPNPRYAGPAPHLARIEVRVVPDPSTNLTLLRSGQLDWNLVAPAQLAALHDVAGLRYRSVPLALVAGIAINTAHPPLDDVRVRRALAASIDRAAISAKITLGKYPVVDTAQPLGSWARDPAVRLPRYDPASADRALDAAGWRRGAGGMRSRDGRALALTYVQFPESQTGVRVATFVQRALRERGVDVTIKSISNAQLFLPGPKGGTLATGAFDLAYVPWSMSADPDDSFLLACGAPQNYMRWCDREVDALERRAIVATGNAERRTLYGRIERRVAEAVPIVYLFAPAYQYAYRDGLAGFAPNGFAPTWNAEAWQWQR